MPVTRSSSQQESLQPASQPYGSRRAGPSGSGGTKKASKAPSNEIIVLSSDDDEPPPKGTLFSKKTTAKRSSRKKTTPSVLPQVLSQDVLEISSDDEVKAKKPSPRKQAKSSESVNKDLAIKKLNEEMDRYKQMAASSCQEVEELKRDRASRHELAKLEENTSCEVCAVTMWCPYILPECGHSFCEGCLIDWFGTIQAQHLTANPQLDNNRAALVRQLDQLVQMAPNLHAYGPHGLNHMRTVITELRRHRPEYTCPSCRKAVLNKPVEDFRLKALVKDIAGMLGETDSPKDVAPRESGPFDHFFAAPMVTG